MDINEIHELLYGHTKQVKKLQEDFCLCGNTKSPENIFCSECLQERYAERKQSEREYSREIYGPDVANGD